MTASGIGEEDWALWRDFVRMSRDLDRALEHRLQHDAGLSTADFDVLLALTEAAGHRLRSGALADALDWEKSRISHQVRRMAERGLLQRTDCPTDARGTWVVLSDAGADAFARAACGYAEVLRAGFLDALGRDHRQAFGAGVRRVASALDPAASPVSAG